MASRRRHNPPLERTAAGGILVLRSNVAHAPPRPLNGPTLYDLKMPDRSITRFLATLKTTYGDKVTPYGTSDDEEHGVAFRIEGVDATFSVVTLDGSLPEGRYDAQIESYPPGDYVLSDEFDIDALFAMIARIVRGERPVV